MPTLAARMLGLAGFVVTAAAEVGGELELVVESTETVAGCSSCGTAATAHGRGPTWVRDILGAGRSVMLCWQKRIRRCDERRCRQRTWSEISEAIAPRAALTERARAWATRRVGADGDTVAQVAAGLSVGWHTVMRAVRAHGRPLIGHPARIDGVTAIGVDEHAWQHASQVRHTQSTTRHR